MVPAAKVSVGDVLRESAGTWLGLIFAVVVLVWILARVRAWFREGDDPAETTDRLISEIREMYEEGKLSEEEFRSIKGRLTTAKDHPSTEPGE